MIYNENMTFRRQIDFMKTKLNENYKFPVLPVRRLTQRKKQVLYTVSLRQF